MKFGVVNVNRFFLHTLQRNITHLAVITRKTNIKFGILKVGNWKRAEHRKKFYEAVRTSIKFEQTTVDPKKKHYYRN